MCRTNQKDKRRNTLGSLCLGWPVIEVILKSNVIVARITGGGREGMLGDGLILIVVSCHW